MALHHLSTPAGNSWRRQSAGTCLRLFAIGVVIVLLQGLCSKTQASQSHPVLRVPPRLQTAPSGNQFATSVASLALAEREERIVREILSGNVPNYLRRLSPVPIEVTNAGSIASGIVYVTSDYLSIGSDGDAILMPMSPGSAQRIANALDCSLPTRRLVDAIHRAAPLKLFPSPIAPSPAMTAVPVFVTHNEIVWKHRARLLSTYPPGTLVAGHKKDLVITPKLLRQPDKVAIYGWHNPDGEPIQPLYLGHSATWVDYSQCARLVWNQMLLNGKRVDLVSVLKDAAVTGLLSDEGPFEKVSYPTGSLGEANSIYTTAHTGLLWSLEEKPFTERTATLRLDPDLLAHFNMPDRRLASQTNNLLIIYALPNGNTIEQTVGKHLQPGDDWRFDIQHIGAQTRFLRQVLSNDFVVIAYLENSLQSWPGWRKRNGDQQIPNLLLKLKEAALADSSAKVVLTGHSGGGSFIFGLLNSVDAVPDDVVRIAFLDSNYAYERSQGHTDKLLAWLCSRTDRHLCVLAYDDESALLEGKPFVTPRRGTWGRTHAMLDDIGERFSWTWRTNGELRSAETLRSQAQVILIDNPERKIFHTVQVERNGFIHALLSGTAHEGRDYEYFGPRAYAKWIASEAASVIRDSHRPP